ncbi:hypothetical protein SLEP1_g49774 [Rubroshorea leprosula]|uniref:Uncharacterized protein n=1 Tax=Rubroshorea leprosula TaxID=152421 RepID=A0AAV5M064_9ROSI|nr:hypothetical protein SLEP1_g49774 [Rubroshorea leprosula]
MRLSSRNLWEKNHPQFHHLHLNPTTRASKSIANISKSAVH